jgi:hypothetical protein
MAKAISVTLGIEHFEKKGDVKLRIQQLVASYPLMSFIGPEDFALCSALFKHHPTYLQKAGDGISAIQIRIDEYGKRYLHIHRVDGTDEDISWIKCLASI